MTDLEKAARMALEALEELNNTKSYWWQEVDTEVVYQLQNSESALRQALQAHSSEDHIPDAGKMVEQPAQREDWGQGPHEHHSLPEQPYHIPDAGKMVEQPAQGENK